MTETLKNNGVINTCKIYWSLPHIINVLQMFILTGVRIPRVNKLNTGNISNRPIQFPPSTYTRTRTNTKETNNTNKNRIICPQLNEECAFWIWCIKRTKNGACKTLHLRNQIYWYQTKNETDDNLNKRWNFRIKSRK